MNLHSASVCSNSQIPGCPWATLRDKLREGPKMEFMLETFGQKALMSYLDRQRLKVRRSQVRILWSRGNIGGTLRDKVTEDT